MSKLTNLNDLYIEELRDLHSAETQLLKALPEMADAAHDPRLRELFIDHLRQTEVHVGRLETIFETLGEKAKGKTCKAMKGLVAEGKEHIKERATPTVRDAALIAAAQRVEHYEISGYGTARTFATMLGYPEAVTLLQETLNEEGDTDHLLTEVAKSLNLEAMVGTDIESIRP
jgi:ferritin-like metal-binding protein YciE